MFKKPIFINPRRGEVAAIINNKAHCLCLTLSALAYLESCYDGCDILELTKRFAENGLSAKDVQNILQAGLFGRNGPALEAMEVRGGFEAAVEIASLLLERAFGGTGHDSLT